MKRFLSSVLLVSTILAGCTQSSPIGTMDFEDESPLEIPAVGQELKLKVAWENVRWKISEQTEDASKSIISSIMPVYSGSTSGKGVTEVTVSIKENMTSVRKTAVLTLICAEGTTDGRQRTLTITQAPLYVEGENDNALITVRSSTTYQTIDGFGGMNLLSNWGKRELLTDSEVDKVFGTNEMQLGLSIMRIILHPEKNSWNIAVPSAKRAYEQYGVRILASPWSPPVYMKSNGSLVEDKYEEYAEYLEEFARYMKDSGAPLYAVSIQNELDWEPDYEGCVWNSGHNIDTAVATCTSKEESSAGISCTKDGDTVILDLKSRSITTLVVS